MWTASFSQQASTYIILKNSENQQLSRAYWKQQQQSNFTRLHSDTNAVKCHWTNLGTAEFPATINLHLTWRVCNKRTAKCGASWKMVNATVENRKPKNKIKTKISINYHSTFVANRSEGEQKLKTKTNPNVMLHKANIVEIKITQQQQ